jgi:allantoinase
MARMDNKLYSYSPIVGRPPLAWPGGREREWTWLARGRNNSTLTHGLSENEERAELTAIVEHCRCHADRRPRRRR